MTVNTTSLRAVTQAPKTCMLMAFFTGMGLTSNAPITSLRRAAGAKDAAVLSQLLGHITVVDAQKIDADCDESGRSALHHACWRGSLSNVERLLDLRCDFDAWSTGDRTHMTLESHSQRPLSVCVEAFPSSLTPTHTGST